MMGLTTTSNRQRRTAARAVVDVPGDREAATPVKVAPEEGLRQSLWSLIRGPPPKLSWLRHDRRRGSLPPIGAARVRHVYVTETLDAATWAAELATGEGRGRIYVVEPLGALEDDPNVTDTKFPGNPTRSHRTREPVRVVGEIPDWSGHSAEQLQAMRDGLADLRRRGQAVIDD